MRTRVPLAPLTTLRCGGPAGSLATASSESAVVELIARCDERGEPVLVLGHGSNVVISDDGFPGTVVLIGTHGVLIEDVGTAGDQCLVRAAAGETWDEVVGAAADAGLSGIESLSGIPGTAGAAPVQNIGAYGSELSDAVQSVTAWDRRSGRIRSLAAAECGFGYRTSRFKRECDTWVVLEVALLLARGPTAAPIGYEALAHHMGLPMGSVAPIGDVRRAVLDLRRDKGMVLDSSDHDTWSVGSFFMNPTVPAAVADRLPPQAPRWPRSAGRVKLSAAWLIEASGCHRGWAVSPDAGAAISGRHTLALTNRGNATTADIVALAGAIVRAVRDKFGIDLEPEPTLVGCAI